MTDLKSKAKTITEWMFPNNPEKASILIEIQRKLRWKEDEKLVTLEEAQSREDKIVEANKILSEPVKGSMDKFDDCRQMIYSYAKKLERLREVLKVEA